MVEVSSDGSGGGRDSRCFHGDHFGNCGGISAVVLWISVDPLVITFLFRTRVVTLFNFFFMRQKRENDWEPEQSRLGR